MSTAANRIVRYRENVAQAEFWVTFWQKRLDATTDPHRRAIQQRGLTDAQHARDYWQDALRRAEATASKFTTARHHPGSKFEV